MPAKLRESDLRDRPTIGSMDGSLDLDSHERMLRRSAAERSGEATDPELASLLSLVAQRRSARVAGSRVDVPDEPAGSSGAGQESPVAPTRSTGAGGEIRRTEEVGDVVRIVEVIRPSGFSFAAGQYVSLSVGSAKRRSFSIASAPDEPHLEFCVKLNASGSLTPALFALSVGDRVEVGDTAKGTFSLDRDATHHLMVATTTGIAPLRSMIRDALQRGSTASFTILHSAPNLDGLPYRDELTGLADERPEITYVPTATRSAGARPDGSGGASGGRVDQLAMRVASGLDRATVCVYACGNKAMVASVNRTLSSAGFQVRTESYG